MVMERLFNPLARELSPRGFHAKVRGDWSRASGSRILRAAHCTLAALSPPTTFSARSFRIGAVRR
jgi:hypothetical protein